MPFTALCDNNKAFIHPRFVEKLYVYSSGAKDLSRRDMSFDALLSPDIGVGIKTFISDSISISKYEKVAEFTRHASLGEFDGLDHYRKAIKSSELRNNRIISDANEYSIDINKSIYHCLVRTHAGAIIHHEPYQLINITNIKPIDNKGIEISEFISNPTGNTYFTDEQSNYCYNRSKNVLYKKFDISKYLNSRLIPLIIFDDIFSKIIKWTSMEAALLRQTLIQDIIEPKIDIENDYIVLPLYTTSRCAAREVQKRSGINQWNADGRKRKFGESYIPIPKIIHNNFPGFFPNKEEKFKVKLPNGKVILAKVCQENNKALMSYPNTDLCSWLYKIIDLNDEALHKRFLEKRPYTYLDLKLVGKDSVKITKVKNKEYQYEIESMDISSYENFILRGNKNTH